MRSNEDIVQIYRRHVKTVYRLCFSYLKSESDTEDAVQNVFIKLINYEKAFNDAEHEKAWLITCAANHCKDILKSAYRTRTDFDVVDDIPDTLDERGGSSNGGANSEGADMSDVYEAVLALPEKYKDCVYLHYYEGYKTDEIAKIVGRTPSTVRSHLSEARALLKERLGGGADER